MPTLKRFSLVNVIQERILSWGDKIQTLLSDENHARLEDSLRRGMNGYQETSLFIWDFVQYPLCQTFRDEHEPQCMAPGSSV